MSWGRPARPRVRKLLATALTAIVGTVAFAGLAPQPASAEIQRDQGRVCGGTAAYRCAWINVDTTNNVVRAYGFVINTNAANSDVWITVEVTLDRDTWDPPSDGGWDDVERSSVNQGVDYVENATVTHKCKRGEKFRASVRWTWQGDPTVPPVRSAWVNIVAQC